MDSDNNSNANAHYINYRISFLEKYFIYEVFNFCYLHFYVVYSLCERR
nr:MAG TPA: hypothetical protein [Bacteriophage sp.]